MRDIDFIRARTLELGCYSDELSRSLQNIEDKVRLLQNIQQCLFDSKTYLVYRHTDPYGKVYIGITKNTPQARWNKGTGYKTQEKFFDAIVDEGWRNFSHEIVAAGLSESEAKFLENKLILEHRANESEFGYNTVVVCSDDASEDILDASHNSVDEDLSTDEATLSDDEVVHEAETEEMDIFPPQIKAKLHGIGIDSLDALTNLTYSDLLSQPWIGEKTAKHIKLILEHHSLALKEEVSLEENGEMFFVDEMGIIPATIKKTPKRGN